MNKLLKFDDFNKTTPDKPRVHTAVDQTKADSQKPIMNARKTIEESMDN